MQHQERALKYFRREDVRSLATVGKTAAYTICAAALTFLLAAGLPFSGHAQTCVPVSQDLLAPAHPGAPMIRPRECSTVEQSPPDFSWPHIGTGPYTVSLTFPDGHSEQATATYNWLNWNAVLPAGNYSWTVTRLGLISQPRLFTIGTGAMPFVVPDMTDVINQLLAKPHPRGLPDEAMLSTMASQRGSTLSLLRNKVDSNLSEQLPSSGRRGDGFAYYNSYSMKALWSLMAYVYHGTETYQQDARRRVLNLASWDPRGPTAVDDRESINVAWVVTLGYDWLGPALTQAEKDQILASLGTRIGDLESWIIGTKGWPYNSTDLLLPLWQLPRDSHRSTWTPMLAVMSTLLVGDLPAASTWLQDLLPFALNVASPWGGEDGGHANGTAYGVWDVGLQLSAWYALRWATCGGQQTCIDLAQKPWVRNYGRFLAYFVPATAKTGNPNAPTTDPGTPIGLFGDGFEENQLFEERSRFGKGYTYFAPSALGCWYASKLIGEDSTRIEYLMSPPNTCAPNPDFPAGTSNSLYLPSTGWMAMHSDLSYLPRTSVYFKSSPPPFGAYDHQSADQNVFVINAGGERLAIESGYYGDYDGYGTNHWQWWVKRTKSKNAITFDGGKGQVAFEHQPNPYQITNVRYGSIIQQQSTADYDIITGDATDAYAGALTKAVRSLVYLRPGTILLYENLSSSTGRKWEWNIHALNPIEVIDSSSRIRITSGTESLCVDALAGPGGTFMPINGQDYSSWGSADDDDVSAAPMNPNAPAQYSGKFVSARASTSVEFIALLRVGCLPTAASANKAEGAWTVQMGERTATIDANGIVGVTQ